MRIFYSNETSGIFGVLALALIFVLIFSFIYSFAVIIQWLEPILLLSIAASFVLFIVYVLPFSIVQKMRQRICAFAIILSFICRGSAWLLSFMYIFLYLKWWAVLLMWVFNISTPLAILVLLFNQKFSIASFLFLAYAATYGMRFFALWLSTLGSSGQSKPRFPGSDEEIVDAEIVE